MHIESSATAVSWIPSEAIRGLTKLPFSLGVTHFDDPPPERLAPSIRSLSSSSARPTVFASPITWVDGSTPRVMRSPAMGRAEAG
jgi:hypothetical protein